MTTAFKPYSTMKQVAKLAGEPETHHPRTACHVATKFVLATELQMNREQQRKLQEIVPLLKNTRKPKLSQKRLAFLAERAVRKYAQESLKEAGTHAASAAVRDEPDIQRAGELARRFGANLKGEVPREFRTKLEGRKVAAARSAEHAAKAAKYLSESDPTLQDNAAQATAIAIEQWALATRNDFVKETVALLTNMLSVK